MEKIGYNPVCPTSKPCTIILPPGGNGDFLAWTPAQREQPQRGGNKPAQTPSSCGTGTLSPYWNPSLRPKTTQTLRNLRTNMTTWILTSGFGESNYFQTACNIVMDLNTGAFRYKVLHWDLTFKKGSIKWNIPVLCSLLFLFQVCFYFIAIIRNHY